MAVLKFKLSFKYYGYKYEQHLRVTQRDQDQRKTGQIPQGLTREGKRATNPRRDREDGEGANQEER